MVSFHINSISDKSLGDFDPKLWPKDDNWQAARATLWDYFQATKFDQMQKPLGTDRYRDHLAGYIAPRKGAHTNCFSLACGMVADGLVIEPFFMRYAGLDRLLADEPYVLEVTYDSPYNKGHPRSMNDMTRFGKTLEEIGFTRRTEEDGNPVIALLAEKSDYHFLKVETGFDDRPRVAFVEQAGVGGGLSYHDTPALYFQSLEHAIKKAHDFADPTAFFSPQALNNLKITGSCDTVYNRDNQAVKYVFNARAAYLPG